MLWPHPYGGKALSHPEVVGTALCPPAFGRAVTAGHSEGLMCEGAFCPPPQNAAGQVQRAFFLFHFFLNGFLALSDFSLKK